MKGLDSYQNGTKETWRGWQWNQIVKRLCGPKPLGPAATREKLKDKLVVYLVGPNDVDRDVAVRKGFRSENLIAVDIDRKRVSSTRAAGGLAVAGSLTHIAAAWPTNRPVDALIADFCFGFDVEFMKFAHAICMSPMLSPHAAVSVNLLRGRDAFNDTVRKKYFPDSNHEDKRRNIKVAGMFANLAACFATADANPSSEDTDAAVDAMSPAMYSYKSGPQWFDSVVFTWIGCAGCRCSRLCDRYDDHAWPKRPTEMAKRQISATMAIRTARTRYN